MKRPQCSTYNHLDSRGNGYTLRLEIDTGVSGNTLLLRTLEQMYGNNIINLVNSTNNIKLTEYNGEEIRCLRSLDIQCQFRTCGWKTTRFYMVDVPGLAVVGLPTREEFKQVNINVDGVMSRPN